MSIAEIKDKRIAVLGLGVNNRFLTAYLLRHGCASITVRDKNQDVRQEFANQFPDIPTDSLVWDIRPDILEGLHQFDLVFRSPSIPVLSDQLQALKGEVEISSQTKLFFDLCPAGIIGVTGSKGKGTTCTLIHRILTAGYRKGKAYLAGNIGVDPFQFLDDLQADDLVVLELSSFQLQDLEKSPQTGILLRITPDHLDHHRTMEEYVQAKVNLIAHQNPDDTAVICAEQEEARHYAKQSAGHTYFYTRHQPQENGGWAEGQIVQVRLPGEEAVAIDVSERMIPGDHNLENIIPACMVGVMYGVDTETIKEAVVKCAGLPHRLHKFGEYKGVELYDDSIATTPESCLMALQAFEGRRIHLIAGGKDKGQKYDSLAPEISKRCVSVSLLPGEATWRLEEALKPLLPAGNLITPQENPYFPEILRRLEPLLQPNDLILLSPAAASDAPFFMYVKRAEAFIKAAEEVYGIKGDES